MREQRTVNNRTLIGSNSFKLSRNRGQLNRTTHNLTPSKGPLSIGFLIRRSSRGIQNWTPEKLQTRGNFPDSACEQLAPVENRGGGDSLIWIKQRPSKSQSPSSILGRPVLTERSPTAEAGDLKSLQCTFDPCRSEYFGNLGGGVVYKESSQGGSEPNTTNKAPVTSLAQPPFPVTKGESSGAIAGVAPKSGINLSGESARDYESAAGETAINAAFRQPATGTTSAAGHVPQIPPAQNIFYDGGPA